MKLDQMCYEKLTKYVVNQVGKESPLRNDLDLMIWKWVFEVLRVFGRVQQQQFLGGRTNGVFGKRKRRKNVFETVRWPVTSKLRSPPTFTWPVTLILRLPPSQNLF